MRLLVATGGSPHSRLATAFAADLATRIGGTVTLLCVQEGATECQAVFKSCAPLLANFEELAAHVRHGQPAEEIIREAETGDYDAVILGEKGHHTPLTRFLIGATAERVASAAPIPVLVVKGDPSRPPRPIRRVLVSLGLRKELTEVDRVLRRVCAIAGPAEAHVTVLHVMSQLPIASAGAPDDWQESADELVRTGAAEGLLLAHALEFLGADGVTAVPLVRHGLVVEEVLEESASGDYDLLVIGGHEPGTWLRKLVLENVALQILHRTRVPILTVHG